MKILVVRTSDGTIGGAERSAFDHVRSFKSRGERPIFLTNKPDEIARSRKCGIKTFRSVLPARKISNLSKLLLQPLLWVQYIFLAILTKPNIINAHSREDYIVFTLSKPMHRSCVIWKDPGDLIHLIKLKRQGFLGRINQLLLVKAFQKADAIYFLNQDNLNMVSDRLHRLGCKTDKTKLSVIESNIYFEDYNLEAKCPRVTDKLVFGTITRLTEHKGVQYFLRAANILSERYENLEFWVVGTGPFENELKKIPNKNSDVVFWGYQENISKFMTRIDIFVQPSEFEGWGRNIKEAMYFGKPIVGSNVGGIALQINNGYNGLLFETKNVSELVMQLEKLINNTLLRKKLGNAARQKALKDGDYKSLAKNKILPLFYDTLSNVR